METRFNEELQNALENKGGNCGALNEERYQQLLQKTRESKSKTSGKKPEDYQRLKRYDIFKYGDCEKLICPVTDTSSSIRFYVHTGEIFDIIHQTHLATGHGGRTKILKHVQNIYKNITQEQVTLYLRLCEPCQKKLKTSKKEHDVIRPLSEEIDSRCQVDLIDMHDHSDSDYEFIFVYQDLRTMFVQLRPLKSKRVKEVARALLDVFTILGAPSVLQSDDNGREFCNQVLEELNAMWNDLKMVHGEPIHSQSQGSVSQCVQDVLKTWTEVNQTSRWSEVGLKFVQFKMNRTYHEGIKCSPYEAMFGVTAKVGLTTSSLSADTVDNLKTEEQLRALIDVTENYSAVRETRDDNVAQNHEANLQEERTEQNKNTMSSYSTSVEGTSSNDAICNKGGFIKIKREGDQSVLESQTNKIIKK